MSFGPSASLHPSHTLRCGPRPLTAAGGQGPQDNTAYGYAYPLMHTPACPAIPFICGRLDMPGLGCNKQYCPSDLPLRSIPPTPRCGPRPLAAAGGQGPQDNTAYDLHIHSCTLKPAPKLLPTRFTAILPFCFIPWGAHAAHRLRTGEPFVTVAQPLRRSTYMENRGHGKDLCTSAWNPPSPLATRFTCKTEGRPNGHGESCAAYQPALREGEKPQRGAVIPSGAPSA